MTSAFRAQRPAIGRRGNFKIVKELAAGGAIRTPVPGFKVQGPSTRRPGIKLSAESLSCTAHTRPPIHRGCVPTFHDPSELAPPVRGDLFHDRNTPPMQSRF